MKLQTKLNIGPSNWKITYQHSILTIGSCFSVEISNYLNNHKFNVQSNPTGICYNPLSIVKTIDYCLGKEKMNHQHLFLNNGVFSHFDFHGSFSNINQESAFSQMTNTIEKNKTDERPVDLLILSLGTAFAFKHKSSNAIVNNCHKLNNALFDRVQLGVNEIVDELSLRIEELKTLNSDLKLILTVSPIRHIRDGLVKNQLSKSTLILACHELAKSFDYMDYFPSYEILLDELRDYRFYNEDMIHPSSQAVQIILDRFKKTYFSQNEIEFINRIQKINERLNHRALNPNTQEHKLFLQLTIEKIKELNHQEESINFEKEIKVLEKRIAELAGL